MEDAGRILWNCQMNKFFVSGYNKSGTTFIQMLLDAHPTISCPSEYHLTTLVDGIVQLSKKHLWIVESFDKSTADQGVRFDDGRFNGFILRNVLLFLFQDGVGKEITHSGINDNSLIDRAEMYFKLIPDSRFIFIVRDPRDIGISLWHHRVRTEKKFATSGQKVEEMAEAVARFWPTHIAALERFKALYPDNVYIFRYEDLISENRKQQLSGILNFLKVDYEDSILDKMFEATDFSKLKSGENKSTKSDIGFFRKAGKYEWRRTLDEETKEKVVASAGEWLEKYNYILRE